MARSPLSADEAMAKAKKLAGKGHHAAAASEYRKILAANPRHKKAKKLLQSLERSSGTPIDRSRLQSDMSELMQSYAQDAPEKTLKLAHRLVERYPDQPMPINIQGAVLAKAGKHESAVKSFRKALSIEPRYPDALSNLGRSLLELGLQEEAIKVLNSLSTLQPDNPETLFELGNALRKAGEFEAAVSAYRQSIALNPDSRPAHYSLAQALDGAGEQKQAIVSFRNAIEIDRNFVNAYLGIGKIFQDQQQFDMSISWFNDAIKLDPGVAQAHFLLARSLHQAGRNDEAIAAYRRCLELDPSHKEAGHFIAAAEGRNTDRAPRDYVESLFDSFAPSFERQLAGELGYRGPEILKRLVQELAPEGTLFENALDLGCGTGLAGKAFKDGCKKLVGIDLSHKMLQRAASKQIYDQLLHGDLVEVTRRLEEPFDLIICADTVVYIGDLQALFSTIGDHSRNNTLFVLSTEHLENDGRTLLPSGRYAHSRAYIEECARNAHFAVLRFERKPLRQEFKQWLDGGYYLLQYQG